MPEVLHSEDQERADLYGLIAALLLRPDGALIDALAALPGEPADDGDALARAWVALLDAARRCGTAALDEHADLFIATGTPRFSPYQGYYLDGWLMDKPLARLRDELRTLGFERASGATELEDHLGALCETMRLLIDSGRPPEVQHAFFRKHIAPWSERCLHDIHDAPDADFYRALAAFALVFFERETLHEQALA